jgi:hypothetical protein
MTTMNSILALASADHDDLVIEEFGQSVTGNLTAFATMCGVTRQAPAPTVDSARHTA